MVSREALCPECGYPLSVSVEEDEETGELKIVLFCEGAGDDIFRLEIFTGLTNDDLYDLEDGTDTFLKMRIKVEREQEPEEYIEDEEELEEE